jgi:hypothetical protein
MSEMTSKRLMPIDIDDNGQSFEVFLHSCWDSSFRGGVDALPDSGRAIPGKPNKPVSQHNFTAGCQKSQSEFIWRKKNKNKEIREKTSLPFPERFELRGESHHCSEM